MRRAALACLFLVATAHAEQDAFPGVQRLMTDEEFAAAGLDALDEDQLRALNAWVVRYTAEDADVMQASSEAVQEVQRENRAAGVTARIEGDFDGWSGDTVFTLDNGQIWRQRIDGRYRYDGPPNPEVVIKRNFFGFHEISVVGTDAEIGVRRLR